MALVKRRRRCEVELDAAAWEPRMGMTQAEVAKELGVSQAEVMRIERRAIRKLRAMPEARKLVLLLARFEMAIQPEEW